MVSAFPVRCWSNNYDLVWNTWRQDSKYNPTLHFGHLNLILVCFSRTHKTLYSFAFWGQWSIARWKRLVFPVGCFEAKAPFHPPLNLNIKPCKPTENHVSSSTMWCNEALPLLPVCWAVSQVIVTMFTYQTLILWTATVTASCQQNVFMWEWLVSSPQKFLTHKVGGVKSVCICKWIHSS